MTILRASITQSADFIDRLSFIQMLLFATLVLISGEKCLRKVNGQMKKEMKKFENSPIGRSVEDLHAPHDFIHIVFFITFEKNKAMKKLNYTAIIEKSEDGWYVGQVQEIPEAIAQGKTIEELKQNLIDALELVIDFHREQTNSLYQGRKIIKRKLNLA